MVKNVVKEATVLLMATVIILSALIASGVTTSTCKERACHSSCGRGNTLIADSRNNWPLTENNSWIRDIPTLHDFVPIGVVHMETEDHILKNLPDPKWGLQCFIFAGEGETEDGKHKLIVQARVPIEGSMQHRIYLDGQWYLLPATKAPMYFDDEKRIFPYPTVYTSGETPTSLSYDEQGRRWILKIENPEHDIILEIEGKARGIPFWMGKAEGPYIIHGVSWNVDDVDTWGGFWDVGTFEANLVIPGNGGTFNGNFLFDRAYHRSYYQDGGGSHLTDFTCMHLHNENFDLMFSHSNNPSPIETPVPFQHQARINFLGGGEDFTFNNFEYCDDGGLRPNDFHLTGFYEGGEIDLIGVSYEFWPENWGVNKGAWWDDDGKHTWGRAFIEWSGTITLNGETINIDDALGVGEFTRFETSYPSPPIIEGRTLGKPGNEYEYSFTSTDPEGDDIAGYVIDWGDGSEEILEGPFISGETATANHTWIKKGTYTARAKARDIHGSESDWETLTVSMSKNKAIGLKSLFLRFFEKLIQRFPLITRLLQLPVFEKIIRL